MQTCQGIRDAVLAEVVAGRHFPAEAIAAVQDGHLRRVIRCGLNQYRDAETRKAQRVRNRALVAEVGQGDDDAVDLVAMFSEQGRAALSLFMRFDCSVLAVFGTENDGIDAGLRQRLNHLLASGLRQLVGKKAAISDDDAHRHFLFVRHMNSFDYEIYLLRLTIQSGAFSRRGKTQTEKHTKNQEESAPPHVRVQIVKHDLFCGRIHQFIDSPGKDKETVHAEAQPSEKPDRQRSAGFHATLLPENDLQNHKSDGYNHTPENRAAKP